MRSALAPLALAPLALAIPLALAGRAAAEDPARYVAVVPAGLRAAVAPLLEHRAAQGLDVQVVDAAPGATGEALRREVLARRPGYVLLVGDVDLVPAFEVAEATTDRPYGDADGDGLPEASVGRLPTSDPAALGRVVARTLDYERRDDDGAWRKQCALIAGEGRFGQAVDAIIENMFQRVVSKNIPPAYDVDLTYANPRSPFCYPPERFADRVVSRLDEGALVVAYVGHGAERSVDELTVPLPGGRTRSYDVLDAARAAEVDARGAPVMVAIACWTGRYEAKTPCIGEELLLTGKGPVAFLGATRISHPIPNAVLAVALVGELFGDAHARLGPALDAARRALVVDTGDPLRREILTLGGMFTGPGEMDRELPRHVDMYNLLGDPALVLRRPARDGALEAAVAMTGDGAGAERQAIRARGRVAAGPRTVTVTLEVPRERMARPAAAPGETPFERYARANDRVLATAVAPVGPDGAFEVWLPLPPGVTGTRHLVKAFAQGGGCAALATTVDLPPTAARPAPAPPAGGRVF